MEKEKTICIVGRGVDPTKHLSLIALNKLQMSDKIIGIESEKSFWKKQQIECNLPNIEYIEHLYSSSDMDLVNYDRFVAYVLDLSSQYVFLSLLVAGHPLLGVSFIERLKTKIPRNTKLEIIEGISSFDTMMSLLQIDPLEQGTVILDANRLLLFRYEIEKSFGYFVYHICSVGNSTTNYLSPGENNRVDLLKSYLLRFYSPEKEMVLCRSANGNSERSTLAYVNLSELDSCLAKIDYSTTLYIPPEKPNKLDWEFLELLRA